MLFKWCLWDRFLPLKSFWTPTSSQRAWQLTWEDNEDIFVDLPSWEFYAPQTNLRVWHQGPWPFAIFYKWSSLLQDCSYLKRSILRIFYRKLRWQSPNNVLLIVYLTINFSKMVGSLTIILSYIEVWLVHYNTLCSQDPMLLSLCIKFTRSWMNQWFPIFLLWREYSDTSKVLHPMIFNNYLASSTTTKFLTNSSA